MSPLPAWKGSLILPCAPTGCRCPEGSGFYLCPPHRIPQTQDNSNRKTRRILDTYHAQASKHITSHPIITAPFEMGGIIVPISQMRKPRQTGARLPGLGLVLGLANGRPQQEVAGRKRDGAFWSLAGLCAPAGCLAAPPTAPGPYSFKKRHLAHSFRSRDRNAPLYCWPCWGPSPSLLILLAQPTLSPLSLP